MKKSGYEGAVIGGVFIACVHAVLACAVRLRPARFPAVVTI